MRYVQATQGGLPTPMAAQSTTFTTHEFGDVKAFVLPQAEEFAEALDPRQWQRKGKIVIKRSEEVTTTEGRRLVVRSVRPQDNVIAESFSHDFPPANARDNILKADYIYRNLRYEDDMIEISAERPLGYIRHPDGREEEVFLALSPEYCHYGKVDHSDRSIVDGAWKRYNDVKMDLNGIMYVDTDMAEKGDNVLFHCEPGGKVRVLKKDTEYTRIVDLGCFNDDCERVDGMLRDVGVDPADIEGKSVYRSLVGHVVSEKLIDATTLLNPIQTQELLSQYVGGQLAITCWEYSNHDPTIFMSTLTTTLTDSREIVPGQRCDFIRANTKAINDSQGQDNELNRLRAGIKWHKRIRLSDDEKGEMIWR